MEIEIRHVNFTMVGSKCVFLKEETHLQKIIYSSLITIKTPLKIKIVPNQKEIPMVSPNSNQPNKVPTIGWKKKNNPPLEAFINCKPLFHNKKPPAVEIMPKYNNPPEIVGVKMLEKSKSFNFGRISGVKKMTAIIEEYVVTTICE